MRCKIRHREQSTERRAKVLLPGGAGGIAVNLRIGNDILHKKVSPRQKRGVVGTIDYLIYTVFYFPTGVVDSLISSYLYSYEKPKPL
jgi:hypothetical protein